MIKQIGDKLSALIDEIDGWFDTEFEYFKRLIPCRGKRFKK